MRGFFKFGNPTIELEIGNIEVEFLLDTGFNGEIMLSKGLIKKLNLEMIGITDYITASGERNYAEVYKSYIILFEKRVEVTVLSSQANFSLAGMELFHNYKILIERHKDILEIS